jgi:hypothetical protein
MRRSTLSALWLSISAFALTAMSDDGARSTQQSLKLLWDVQGETVTIRVVGESHKARDLRYRMTVSGGSASTTAGRARLLPDKHVTVAIVRVKAKGAWDARLEVTGDENYRLAIGGS